MAGMKTVGSARYCLLHPMLGVAQDLHMDDYHPSFSGGGCHQGVGGVDRSSSLLDADDKPFESLEINYVFILKKLFGIYALLHIYDHVTYNLHQYPILR